jgi:hypothetical protein
MKRQLALLLALVCASPVFATVDETAGTTGGSFLKMGQGSARALSLGKAYVAIAEGSDALTWNPAGLALTQQKELAYSYMRTIKELSTPLYLGYAHPMGRTVWGVNMGYVYTSFDGLDVRDGSGRPQSTSSAQVRDGFGSVGLARSFWYEKLFLGGALRIIHEDNAGSVHDSVAGDIGAILKPNNVVSLGFSAQNLGTSKDNASQIVRGGVGFKIGEMLTTSLELNDESGDRPRIGLGAEIAVPEEYLEFASLTLRAGYYTADNLGQSLDPTLQSFQLDRSNGFTFGFGIFTTRAFGYGLSIDYAVVPSGAAGTVDQISLKVRF